MDATLSTAVPPTQPESRIDTMDHDMDHHDVPDTSGGRHLDADRMSCDSDMSVLGSRHGVDDHAEIGSMGSSLDLSRHSDNHVLLELEGQGILINESDKPSHVCCPLFFVYFFPSAFYC
jgi:hypothetical protein